MEKLGLMQNKKLIAITGGIGSGKSQVLKIMQKLGYNTLSCDKITTELYSCPKIKRKLKKAFPNAVSGFIFLKVDKGVIANAVFSDTEKMEKLNAILLPPILERVFKRAKNLTPPVFIEVPLLFEKNLTDRFDHAIVVLRALESRIDSVISRSNLTRNQVELRIKNQFDYDNSDFSAFSVIHNDGDLLALEEKVKQLLSEIL